MGIIDNRKVTIMPITNQREIKEYYPELPNGKEERFDDQYDVIKFLCEVETRAVKGNIGSDFVLAKLSDTKKEFLIQQTKIAFLLKEITPHKATANAIFANIMIENIMMVILNRNVEKNTLLEIVSGAREKIEQEGMTEAQNEGLLEKLKNKVRKNEEKEPKI